MNKENKMSHRTVTALLGTLCLMATVARAQTPAEQGARLARELLLVDTHIDVPYRLEEKWEDVTRLTASGDFDEPRARAGGLDVPFMSIYTPAELETSGGSYQEANELIDSVEALVTRAPEKFVIVTTPMQALRAHNAGKIALAMGMENGSPLEGDLSRVGFFRDRGISYITLAHSLANHLSDSSYDKLRPNGGLSDFGRAVVAEMNRRGVMVDVSHLSDAAFWQVLETSRVPVIASHSSARAFTPGFERNMSDEMIKALAARGGVILINFGSSFLTAQAREWSDAYNAAKDAWVLETGVDKEGAEAKQFSEDYRSKHPFPFARVEDVATHIMHVIELAGIAHVGLGSDYDGVGDSLPVGLKDVSAYPNLVAALLERGVDEAGIAKILGKNLMRVWSQVVAVADEQGRDS
jgi:membrane dipeptidase